MTRFLYVVSAFALGIGALVVSWQLIPEWEHNYKPARSEPRYAYNPRPCMDSWDKEVHHERDRIKYFDVSPPLGCRSGAIYEPGDWFEWKATLAGDTVGCVVFMKPEGFAPWGPFTAETFPSKTPDTYSNYVYVERVAGPSGCKIRFYAENWKTPEPR